MCKPQLWHKKTSTATFSSFLSTVINHEKCQRHLAAAAMWFPIHENSKAPNIYGQGKLHVFSPMSKLTS